LLIAKKYLNLKLDSYDIYFNVVGGIRITSLLPMWEYCSPLFFGPIKNGKNKPSIYRRGRIIGRDSIQGIWGKKHLLRQKDLV